MRDMERLTIGNQSQWRKAVKGCVVFVAVCIPNRCVSISQQTGWSLIADNLSRVDIGRRGGNVYILQGGTLPRI